MIAWPVVNAVGTGLMAVVPTVTVVCAIENTVPTVWVFGRADVLEYWKTSRYYAGPTAA